MELTQTVPPEQPVAEPDKPANKVRNPKGPPLHTRWKKGQSGNPGGKPKELHNITKYARVHSLAAMQTLVKVMKNPKAAANARTLAANSILDRAWGKAPQHVGLTIDTKRVIDMTNQELEAIIAQALPQLALEGPILDAEQIVEGRQDDGLRADGAKPSGPDS